jgi:hypothetical protein
MRARIQLRRFQALTVAFVLLLILGLGIYPGSGGDVSQREINAMTDRSDWWGFMTSFTYGYWPAGYFPWQFTLGVFQLCIFLIGMGLVFKSNDSRVERAIFTIVLLAGLCFAIQIWRDATLFSIVIFAYGLLVKSLEPNQPKSRFLLSSSLMFAFLGCLFKPVFSIIIAVVWVMTISKSQLTRKRLLSTSSIGLVLFLGPIAMDSYLSLLTGMIKSHPEQQVMIYDMAKLQCWSGSNVAMERAKSGLLPLAYSKENFDEICASLTPSGWDPLHTKNKLTEKSPALKLQTGSEVVGFDRLRNAWIGTVLSDPISWINVKVIDASQVILMANSYHAPNFYITTNESRWLTIGDKFLQIPMSIVSFMDRFRFFSLFSSFALGFIMLIVSYSNRARSSQAETQEASLKWQKFLTINLLILLIATLAYLANNGRYVLPFILLNYLFAYQQRNVQ